MLTARDYYGDEEWKRMKQDYDELMAHRKSLKGKPDVYDKMIIDMNRHWIDFYNSILFHTEGISYCDCRRCQMKKNQSL